MLRKKILLVGEDNSILQSVSIHLENLEFDVYQASDSHTALELLGGVKVNCVLADLPLPGFNGQQFARICSEKQPGIPVIVLSSTEGEDASMPANVIAVLERPAPLAVLVDVLRKTRH